ncbi:MAG: DNA-protecting protein DprA [Candidatus Omnitrophica bacterium]|nr:DNA-protecting protein DprA [Candidatus Omnitrophota bacterium]
MNSREALIALTLVPAIGPATIRRLLEALGAPERVFEVSPASLKPLMSRTGTDEAVGQIAEAKKGEALRGELSLIERHGVRVITLLDPDYPELLKQIANPPPVLYVKGALLEEDSVALAMVGTRRASPYGLTAARGLAQGLARCGITVVSGLAEGIDRASHEGALEAGGRTIAVLGHGLSTVYPTAHEELAGKISRQGALVSEFPMKVWPDRGNFPRRNRVIYGLSLGVVVVEAPMKSGALITAREALEQDRELFAVPGPISSERSRGTHQLLKEGAKLVEEVPDILEELKPALSSRVARWRAAESPRGGVSPSGLSPEEISLFEAIPAGGGTGVEDLAQVTALPPSRILPLLTGLELKGLIRQLPGQGYGRLS